MLQPSEKLLSYIREHEQFKAKAYPDATGFSIGYGHFIKPNETHLKTATITKDWAENQLKKDIQPLVTLINNCTKPILKQGMFDGLLDFGYNCGDGALRLALENWENGNTETLTAYIMRYVHFTKDGKKIVSLDLKKRREYEAALINQIDTKEKGAIAIVIVCLFLFFKLVLRVF